MIQLVGGVLVAAGCAWLGFGAADALRRQVRALEAMAQGLGRLEQELERDMPPLPLLMERLAPRSAQPAKELFLGCTQALERLDQECFSAAWQRLVQQLPTLGEQGRQTLLPLGDVLGRCNGQEQCSAVAMVRRQLEELARRAQEDSVQQGKVYRALGVSGGAFLVILLL